MNSFIGTHIDDDSLNKNRGYLVSQSDMAVAHQKAPLPYQSAAGGLWDNAATWSNDASVDAPNSPLS